MYLFSPQGYFSHTVMYYGGYSNKTQGTGGWPEYNMQLAYFFTIAAYMVLCGAALIYRSVWDGTAQHSPQ